MLKTSMLAAAALALATPVLADVPSRNYAGIIVDDYGMTLYTFDKDSKGVSNCTGGCAEAFPPAYVGQGDYASGYFTIIMRDDGYQQWAYYGRPLYTSTQDNKPGDTNADGFNGTWHIAK